MLDPQRRKHIFTIALLICVGLSCKSFTSLGKPHVLKSRDGKFELTVPAEMAESSTLSADAEIAAANTPKDLYAFVITKQKSYYTKDMTLDKLTDIIRNEVISKLTVTESPLPEKIIVNGNNARRYRLVGTREGINILYFITMVETSGHFHQIYTWTDPAKSNENEPILKQIADSFRAVSDDGADAGNSPSSR
jgi:hypothetical protein